MADNLFAQSGTETDPYAKYNTPVAQPASASTTDDPYAKYRTGASASQPSAPSSSASPSDNSDPYAKYRSEQPSVSQSGAFGTRPVAAPQKSHDIVSLFQGGSVSDDPNAPWYQKAWDLANLPLVDENRMESWLPEGTLDSLGPAAGLVRGGLDLASGLTSPLSALFMIGTAGSGALLESGGAAALRAAGFGASEVSEVTKGAEILAKTLKAGGKADAAFLAMKQAGLDTPNIMKGMEALTKAGVTSESLLKTGLVRQTGSSLLRNLGVGVQKADNIAHFVQMGTEAGFSAQMLYGAAVASPKVLDALKDGDYEGALRLATDAAGSGLLGYYGGKAFIREAGGLMSEQAAKLGIRAVPSESTRHLVREWGSFDREVTERGRHHELWEEDIRKRYPDIRKEDLPRVMYWMESGVNEEEMVSRYNALAESAGIPNRLSPPDELDQINLTKKVTGGKPVLRQGNSFVSGGANDFAQSRGLKPITRDVVDVDPRAKDIADAFDAMQHDPNNPRVKTAYDAFKRETAAQYKYATEKLGVNFEPWEKEGQPYKNSAEMMKDVKDNKHLYFFKGGDFPADHPMKEVDPNTGLSFNDEFRAVHDFFGHAAEGFQFGPRGEENAWNLHRQMFSDAAVPAMTSETKGQNSWVNFGKQIRDEQGNVPEKGEKGYRDLTDRPYSEQKAGLLPEQFWSRPEDQKAWKPADVIKHILSGKEYAVVQSENPHNERIDDATNAKRTAALKQELVQRGYHPFEVEGHTKDVKGEKEHAFFVPGMTQEEAANFGRKYGQEGVLTREGIRWLGETPESDTITPSNNRKLLTGDKATEKRYYTVIKGPNGEDMPIHVPLNEGLIKASKALPATLKPVEVAQLRKGTTAQRFMKTLSKLPSVEDFVNASKAGVKGRFWYERSVQAFDAMRKLSPDYFRPGDADKWAGTVAALSPQQAVEMNLSEALKFWKEWNDSGRPVTEQGIEKLQRSGEISHLTNQPSKLPNLLKALTGGDLLPPDRDQYYKVGNFAGALRGNLENVTNDSWMGVFAGRMDENAITKPELYHAIALRTREAARELGWEPSQAQAAIWSFTRSLAEASGWKAAGGSYYKPEEMLHQFVPDSHDFADIMRTDKEIRYQLQNLGVDLNELDKHLGSVTPKPSDETSIETASAESLRRSARRIGSAQQQLGGFTKYSAPEAAFNFARRSNTRPEISDEGWFSPTGQFHANGYDDHIATAKSLGLGGYDGAYNKGYIRISSASPFIVELETPKSLEKAKPALDKLVKKLPSTQTAVLRVGSGENYSTKIWKNGGWNTLTNQEYRDIYQTGNLFRKADIGDPAELVRVFGPEKARAVIQGVKHYADNILANADVEYVPRKGAVPGYLRTDENGKVFMNIAFNDDKWDAITINPTHLPVVLERLAKMKESYGQYSPEADRKISEITGLVKQAIKDHPMGGLAVVPDMLRSGWHDPTAAPEEQFHMMQYELGEGKMHAHADLLSLSQEPEMQAFDKRFDELGYDNVPRIRALEAAAHIAIGDGDGIGGTIEQRASFIMKYFNSIAQQHGLEKLENFAPLVQKEGKQVFDALISDLRQEERVNGTLERLGARDKTDREFESDAAGKGVRVGENRGTTTEAGSGGAGEDRSGKEQLSLFKNPEIFLTHANISSSYGGPNRIVHVEFNTPDIQKLIGNSDEELGEAIAKKLFPDLADKIKESRIAKRTLFKSTAGEHHLQIEFKDEKSAREALSFVKGENFKRISDEGGEDRFDREARENQERKDAWFRLLPLLRKDELGGHDYPSQAAEDILRQVRDGEAGNEFSPETIQAAREYWGLVPSADYNPAGQKGEYSIHGIKTPDIEELEKMWGSDPYPSPEKPRISIEKVDAHESLLKDPRFGKMPLYVVLDKNGDVLHWSGDKENALMEPAAAKVVRVDNLKELKESEIKGSYDPELEAKADIAASQVGDPRMPGIKDDDASWLNENVKKRAPLQPRTTPADRIKELVAEHHLQKTYTPKEIEELLDHYDFRNITPRMRELAKEIREHFNTTFERAGASGALSEDTPFKDYVTHMWAKDADHTENSRLLAEARTGQFSDKTNMARHRMFENAFIGQLMGKKLSVNDPIALSAHNGNVFDRVGAARNLLSRLQDSGLKASDGRPIVALSGHGELSEGDDKHSPAILINPKHARSIRIADKVIKGMAPEEVQHLVKDGKLIEWNDKKGNPGYSWSTNDYRTTDHPAFHNWTFLTTDTRGTPIHAKTELRIHPEALDYLKNQLNTKSPLSEIPILKQAQSLGREAKGMLLFGSPFHLFQEGLRAVMTGISPFGAEKWDLEHDDLLGRLVEHQLTMKDYRDIANYQEGQMSGHSKVIAKIPGINKLQDWTQNFLFDRYIPGLKARAAKHLYAEYAKKYPQWDQEKLLTTAAKDTNERFGGINWKREGRTMATQDLFRIAALAPDWLESEVRFMGRALGDEGKIARRDIGRMAVGLWATARVLNLLTTGQGHYEVPFGVAHKDKDGREKVYSLRTMPTDILHAVSDPAGFLKGRIAPLAKAGTEMITGRDEQGRKLPPHNLVMDLAANVAPIWAQTAAKTARGETPDVTNADQLVKFAGGTASVYRTEAQKLSSQLASNRNESGPVDPREMRKHQAVQEFENRIRTGQMQMNDFANLVVTGQVPMTDAMQVKKNLQETQGMPTDLARLYSQASRLPAPDFLQVWDAADNNEKASLIKLFERKRLQYFRKAMKDMTPQERMSDPTFRRFRASAPNLLPF